MAEDSVLSHIMSEFRLWNVKPTIENTGGGHIKITWQASPDKEVRTTFLPKTGSDHRGWLNQRAQVRRLFKQDNLSLKEAPKPVPLLHKALAAPEPVEPQQDQFRSVRVELAELTDKVLELAGMVSTLCQTMQQPAPQQIAPAAPEPAPEPQATIFDERRERRKVLAIEHVSANWNTTAALAKSMGVEPNIAYRKLYYLLRINAVEFSDGRWRKVPPPAPPVGNLKMKVSRLHRLGRRRLGNGAHA